MKATTPTAFLAILMLPTGALSFSNPNPVETVSITTTSLFPRLTSTSSGEDAVQDFLSSMQQSVANAFLGFAFASAAIFAVVPVAPAEAAATTEDTAAISIAACKGGTNCISTGNVRQLNLYAPPWTFETSPEEVVARLKGVAAADPYLEVTSSNADNTYLKMKATRSFTVDNIEFLIKPSDKVVVFRAEQEGEANSVSDFGAIRKEVDSIRQRAKLGVMGEGMSADALPSQNGPLGQLKAFYGLQSGQGFEEVFEEN